MKFFGQFDEVLTTSSCHFALTFLVQVVESSVHYEREAENRLSRFFTSRLSANKIRRLIRRSLKSKNRAAIRTIRLPTRRMLH
jgi:hypothetical protein